jgi:hypothetical protein
MESDIMIMPASISSGHMTKAHGGASMTKIIHPIQCEQCNKYFTPKRAGKFCSRLCMHKSWVAKHVEQWKEYNAKWREDNSNYWTEYYRDGRGVEVQKRRHEKHPLERKARSAISNAIRLGKITKPTRCQICGCETKLEAHHWKGYDKEHWLDVQWLCRTDHQKVNA